MKHFYYTRFLILFILFLVLSSITDAQTYEGSRFRVVEVNDGDTISIKVNSFLGVTTKIERLRLIGIDAPELKQEPWGRISKRYLKKLISESDWVISVEFDIEKRDKYGRLLGYVWDKTGRLINEKMLEDGYAVLYTIAPNVKYTERFIIAQKNAQLKRRGIWSKGGLKTSPQQWRIENPRN
jgi:micrococcal nuclease